MADSTTTRRLEARLYLYGPRILLAVGLIVAVAGVAAAPIQLWPLALALLLAVLVGVSKVTTA